MDTSKEYIKMCEKAGEIQELFLENPNIGDETKRGIVLDLEEFYDDGTWKLRIEDAGFNDSKDCIWLPRQDQLQEMVKIEPAFPLSLVFNIYLEVNRNTGTMYVWSMEQLWLAFVMKEKYNKTWNGKNWIKVV